ncbi:calmodulin [Striga asiatica]|uniref:Calmodulin n=1 Tax=Striga asiatica TaxID=4170 RepID=A0A5A7RES6_STRAF|nr:calmodulin [Striga asiatica]
MADTMTQEQTTEFREAFCLIDKDSDEILLDDIEADGDHGTVDFIEFLDIMSRKMEENIADELKEAFKVFDRDQDGFISAIELRNVMLNLGERLSDEEAEQMIKEADFDGDGLVSFEEFARMMAS